MRTVRDVTRRVRLGLLYHELSTGLITYKPYVNYLKGITMPAHRYGYARVSTLDQPTAIQLEALEVSIDELDEDQIKYLNSWTEST